MTEEPLVVAIPTFRRPHLLARAIESLATQLCSADATLVVGDNDCSGEVEALVKGFAAQGLRAHYTPIPEKGLAQVRNGLVRAACEAVPDWRWLAMIDDDGYVSTGWLDAITGCARVYEADLVGGPVEGLLPEASGALARNSVFASRRRWPTGPVPTLNTTQNLLIGRTLFDRIPFPAFDLRYGASGGEDYDLFRRAARGGARLVWCDEAVVFEPAPADRLTQRALLYRYHSTGMYMASIDRGYDGGAVTLARAVKGLIGALKDVALGSIAAGGRDRVARGALAAAHHFGRLRGLMGLRSARYGTGEAS